MYPDTGAPNAHNTRCVPIRGNGADVSALHQLRRSVSVDNPNQALAQVGVGWGRKPPLSEPRRGDAVLGECAPESAHCRKNRRIRKIPRNQRRTRSAGTSDLQARRASDLVNRVHLCTRTRIHLKINAGGVELIITSHLTQPLKPQILSLSTTKKITKKICILKILL